jgi:hypothetical protein
MSRRTVIFTLLALSALAFALRVGAIFALHRWTAPNAIEHRSLALSLIKFKTFYFRDFNYYGPSSVQSPPYPFLLATLFKLFGPESAGAYIAAMVVNSLAGAATVIFTYLFARAIGGKEIVGLIAAALVAIWPSQVYSATHVQAISLITLAILVTMYFFQIAVTTGKLAPWIGYSLIGCVAALTEPVVLPILTLSGLFIFCFRSLSFEQRARNAAILLGAALLIIFPWTLRNHTVHGQWIPIKSTFWVNVWKGNNPNATGTDRLEMTEEQKSRVTMNSAVKLDDIPHQYDALTPDQRARLNRQPEVVRENVFKEFATTWIAANPGRYATLCLKRFGMSVLFDLDNPKARNIAWIATRIVLFPMTIAGLIIARRQKWRLLFPLLVWGSALLTYTLTVTANRFAIPFEPLQLALTALVLSPLFATRRSKDPAGFEVVMPKAA